MWGHCAFELKPERPPALGCRAFGGNICVLCVISTGALRAFSAGFPQLLLNLALLIRIANDMTPRRLQG